MLRSRARSPRRPPPPSRLRPTAVAILALAALIVRCPPAHAEETLIALVSAGDEPALALRIKAELAALGFAVELVERAVGPDPHGELDAIATEAGAAAALRVARGENGVAVWIADRVTGKLVVRQVPIDATAGDTDAEAALGAVELLRASLMEIHASHRLRGEVAATAVVEELAEPAPIPAEVAAPPSFELLALEAAPVLAVPGFESPPVFDLLVGAHAKVYGPLGVNLYGLIPISFSRVEAAAGDARVHFGLVGAGLRLTFGRPEGRWHPRIGAGFAALFFSAKGTGRGDARGYEELVVTGSPVLRGGLALALTDRVRVTLDALAGWSLAPVRVQIVDDIAASFGQPWLAAALGIEVWLW